MEYLKSFKKVITIVFLLSVLFLVSSCHHHRASFLNRQVSFPNPDYELVKADAKGDSFIFKVLLVIQFGSQGYASAIEDLWQKSNIPDSERANYLLVNTQEYEGIDWSILLCGEDYYSVIGDIVKIKQNPQSQQNNSLSSDIQKLKTVTAPIK